MRVGGNVGVSVVVEDYTVGQDGVDGVAGAGHGGTADCVGLAGDDGFIGGRAWDGGGA
jgi:hypothetical protein